MKQVAIDRLVLDIPGMDAAAARQVALGIAEGLAAADVDGEHSIASLVIDPQTDETPARLAARIVKSLLRQIG